MNDVLVIGAGMAGVTAARALDRAGLSVALVEGQQRLGGRVYSLRDFCAEPVEAGAEFIHGTGSATWPEVRAAGLHTRPCPLIRHTMFNIGHGTHWLPRILLHPAVWPTFNIFRSIARLEPPDLSAREYVERRGFRGRARVLAEMMLTAHLPGRVEEVGVLGLQDDGVLTLESGLNHRVVEGQDRIVEFIGRGLDVRFGFGVESIRWRPDGVTLTASDGRELEARAAVSTLPVGVLQSGRVRFAPALPEGKRAALEQMGMGPVVKLLLSFRERFWPNWLAILGCGTGPVTLYWPLFYGTRDSLPVLCAYSTGPRAARLAEVSEAEAVDIAVGDLARLFPRADPRTALTAHRRIDWGTDPWSCGGYTFLRPGARGARARLAAADTGPLFWAGSATESQPIASTVEAAYRSGLRAAAQARAYLEDGAGAAQPTRPG
ncbi:MAG: FAD-dependent oxidoreductase [Deltaproteobacteria bacterium]|nr:MAG: FAD-dependent oxidoreductase [Deltaproteobacteria bacterium]